MRISVEFVEIDVDALVDELVEEMRRELKVQERLIGGVTKDWQQRHKPEWETEEDLKDDTLKLTLSTESTPFVWVELGHSGGYVKFSRDYRPRTRKGVLSSRARQGSVVMRGKSQGAPKKKPVEAREHHLEVAKRRQDKYKKNMDRALIRGAKKAQKGKKIGKASGVL